MNELIRIFDKYFYPTFSDGWDDKLLRSKVCKYLDRNCKVLDLGAGAGVNDSLNFKGVALRVYGVDLDKRVLSNPYLDEAKLSSAESIPYGDGVFDIVLCNNVLEHLSDPEKVFKEVYRVLKKGGVFICKTPNKYHYVTLFSRISPHWFHVFYNKIRRRAEEDTFPTLYRVNSKKDIIYQATRNCFAVESLELVEGRPEYLRINFLMYLLGILYEKLVNLNELFCNYRVVLLATLRKI